MSVFSPGQEATLAATIINERGELLDPDTITVDVVDVFNVTVVNNAVPTRISLGVYEYVFLLDPDAPEGLWRIDWTAVMANDLTAIASEDFSVAAAGAEVVPGLPSITSSRLRARLAEQKVDPDGDGSDTFFTDNALLDLLSYASGDLDFATLEGWRRKVAAFARLIDISESGSDRALSQRFRNSRLLLEYWAGIVQEGATSRSAAVGRSVVGRVASMREESPVNLLTPFSGATDNIRQYPTHRLIMYSILT